MHVNVFIQSLSSEKHYSPHTINAYRNDLEQFSQFIESSYGFTDIKNADHNIIRSWLAHLIQSEISPRSANRKLSTLKSYFRFLIRLNLIAENPMQKIIAPKLKKKLPVFIEKDKMDMLFDKQVFDPNFTGLRSRLVLEMLYATGMRVSELVSLRNKDIDTEGLSLTVTGKRNKQRIIPFGSHLYDVINDYNNIKNAQFGPVMFNDFFIITDKGKKAYPKLIYNLVTRSLQLVTTQNKKSPHIIRHSFATVMLNHGADLNAIKELLGHSSLAATQVYTHNTIDRIKRIYKQAHPKA